MSTNEKNNHSVTSQAIDNAEQQIRPVRDVYTPLARQRDQFEFLPAALEVLETPATPFGRIIAVTIGAFFVLVVGWACWGTVDVVVVAQGQTIPTGQVKVLQPLETGVVKAIYVQDGQSVQKGELLIELDPTESIANLDSLRFDLLQAQLDAASGAALLSEDPVHQFTPPAAIDPDLAATTQALLVNEVALHQAALAGIRAQIEGHQTTLRSIDIEASKLKKTLPLLQEQLTDHEGLLAKGIGKKPQVFTLRQQVFEQQADLANTVETQAQSLATIAALESRQAELQATFRAKAGTRRQDALRRITTIIQELKKEQQRHHYRQLRAPVSGVVHQLAIHTVGAVVNSAQQLLVIVPDHMPLEIEAMVLNKDIGFMAKDQVVEIKLEAFPFTRYGTLSGQVLGLSEDAITHEQLGPVYKMRVKLDHQAIAVDGKAIQLSPGMSTTVEVKNSQRRIIDYFISPLLRYKDEAIRER